MLLNGRFPCYAIYETKDGQHMSLGALEPKFWQNFCAAIERPDLVAGQFGDEDTKAEVSRIFASKTRDEWVNFLVNVDACCEPVLSLEEAVESQLTASRGMLNLHPDGKRFLASPIRLSDSPSLTDQPAPALGQHTHAILGQLGLSAGELTSLSERGVILVGE
jgi:alpha-methylacyl-CoA racemase